MRDIAFNIILQCRPIDVLSLYMVNKTYHELLKEEYTLKCLINQQTGPLKRDPFKYMINIYLNNHYEHLPISAAKNLNLCKMRTVDLFLERGLMLHQASYKTHKTLVFCGMSKLIASSQFYTDRYQYWLVNVFEPCINNFLVRKIRWQK